MSAFTTKFVFVALIVVVLVGVLAACNTTPQPVSFEEASVMCENITRDDAVFMGVENDMCVYRSYDMLQGRDVFTYEPVK